ncbi:MAG: TonB-dependent receptor, partial [Acidobacteriota bacterium]
TLDQIPGPVQHAAADDILASGALDIAVFLSRRLTAVHLNEVQGNPFQPDVNYRGYTASPLLGTPQGVSVFMDGVRLNQPFGDIVSWDLIPRAVIQSITLMPGSNPLFGLNTLGGALAIQTKDGHSAPGTTVQTIVGSSLRRAVEFEHGGSRASGIDWYLAGNLFAEDGWRNDSPSNVGQLFGKAGWQRVKGDVHVTGAYADTSLTGNGLQEQRLLARDYASVYTKPDQTDNRSTFLNLSARYNATDRVMFSGNAYYRHIRTDTLNGDVNDNSLDQSLYQPGAAERAVLAANGYPDIPAAGLNAANTPFPFLRCIGNVLLLDEPGEKCTGLINRTNTRQHNEGVSAQLTLLDKATGGRNQLVIGAAFDHSGTNFIQSAELGYVNPDRSITGTGAFADGVHGGDVDGEPFDSAVELNGRTSTGSFYLADTFELSRVAHLSMSGRYNRTSLENRDLRDPDGEEGSLNGSQTFSRFNPALGLTIDLRPAINAYAGYSEGSRAATSIEVGCADPDQPCKLPNSLAGDPPLDQVVTKTFEVGLRGGGAVTWNAGYFHADNFDDIQFVASERSGFGYFSNFGKTRRQGIELAVGARLGLTSIGANYTFLDATYQTDETVSGESNSTNEEGPGLGGTIDVEPGNRIPLIPRHMFKAFAEFQVSGKLSFNVDLIGVSSSFARGNENNDHESDGIYYLGPGSAGAYGVVNLDARYQLHPKLELLLQVNNLFNHHYATAAQLGQEAFDANGTFQARPFPAVGGEFPTQHGTFYAPGAPRQAWAGARVKF